MPSLSQTLENLKERIEVLRDVLGMNPNDPQVRRLLVAVYYDLVKIEKPLNTALTPKMHQLLTQILQILLPQIKQEETAGVFLDEEQRKELLEHCDGILTVKDWAGKPFA